MSLTDVSTAAADTLSRVLAEGDIDDESRATLSAMYRAFQMQAAGALRDDPGDASQDTLEAQAAARVIALMRQESHTLSGTRCGRLWADLATDLERRWPQGEDGR